MAKCTARWYWVQYEAKWPGDHAYHVEIKGPRNIPSDVMPSPGDFTRVIKSVMAEYNRRKKTFKIGGCDKGCEGEMMKNQDPPWTGWRSIPFTRTLTRESGGETFEFAVTGRVEVRKRILWGVCMEQEL